MEKMHYKKYRL